ncbi:MAG: ABC transporter ATP-binding protein [Truepera sp.]|nr:ABC transporter ATP-binding protein [Truepera sp.]
MLHIDHLLGRKTADLSGGEMQRVSIGRAIVRRPRVFLMDGPLSNLDAKLRESLRVELEHLQKTRGVTTLFVTHDQIEALTMRLAVLSEGRIIQVGIPEDIHDRPATTYVAQLVGTPRINLVEAARSNGRLRLRRGRWGLRPRAPSTSPKSSSSASAPRMSLSVWTESTGARSFSPNPWVWRRSST